MKEILLVLRNFQSSIIILFPLFRFLLNLFFPSGQDNYEYEEFLPKRAKKHYDFIIVGAGSAGSAVAARLAEINHWNILVLEAGGVPTLITKIPGLHIFHFVTESDYQYKLTPQNYSLFGYKNNVNPYPRGKGLGGCSAINYYMHVRGNKRDFDGWAAMGNEGWDYESVLPYFKKTEDYRGELNSDTAPFHGTDGPMRIEKKKFRLPCGEAFLEAGTELGYRSGIDPNAEEQAGFTVPDLTTKNGLRASTADAFLKPILHKRNFDVLTHATVAKIIFDKNNRAMGVNYYHKGKLRTAYAKKEVILSAGAIDSPKVLMLSGIGPKNHLESFKIPVKVDLPGVGQNFHDQPVIFGLSWTVNPGTAYTSQTAFLNISASSEFKIHRTGPYSVPVGVEANAFVQVSGGDELYPDLQILLMGLTPGFDHGFLFGDAIGFRRDVFDDYFPYLFKRHGIGFGPTLLRPKSRGTITLQSRNPFDQVNIDPNFLSHPDDAAFFVRAIRFCLKIGETKAMKKIGAKFYDKPLLGCKSRPYGSDSFWECYARHMASSIYHPAGTCKMAPPDDPMGVVDNKLRVRGVTGLRVVDASIMPLVTSGNTNAPSIMIGEIAADFIKEDHLESL